MLSPVGNTAEESWQTLLKGQSGITSIEHRYDGLPKQQICRLGKNFDPEEHGISKKKTPVKWIYLSSTVAAGIQADDSGLEITEANAHRVGKSIGSGIGGLGLIESNHTNLDEWRSA